ITSPQTIFLRPLISRSISFLLSIIPRPPTSTLFPYTTLFRSGGDRLPARARRRDPGQRLGLAALLQPQRLHHLARPLHRRLGARSEEHTSELQSQSNLVCRLLLEKKKINRHTVSAFATIHIFY